MKYWLATGIYLHAVFGGACLFDWSPAVVLILCLVGIGVVVVLVPTGPDLKGESLLGRTLKRVK